jgi:hypothetical protein
MTESAVLSLEMSQRLPCGCVLNHSAKPCNPDEGLNNLVGTLEYWLVKRAAQHKCPAKGTEK